MWTRANTDFFRMGDQVEVGSIQRQNEDQIRNQIENVPPDQILSVPEGDMVNNIVDQYHMGVPVVHAEQAAIFDSGEIPIDVGRRFEFGGSPNGDSKFTIGQEIFISIPFTGEPSVFRIRASRYSLCPPIISVGDGNIYLRFSDVTLDGQKIRADIDRIVSSVNEHIGWLRADFDAWNQYLPDFVRQCVADRKNRLLAQRNTVQAIGLPMRRHTDDLLTYAAPEVRRKVKVGPISAPKQSVPPFQPEPMLEAAEFEHILYVICRLAVMLERSPTTFAKVGEEELRDIILVSLNSHYESATGETFNAAGKTDILIRSGEKNVFIGECKFWHGEKKFLEAIDQLLSYLTWRDTKAAVIIFSRNKGFSDVLESIRESIEKHKSFKRTLSPASETSFRYVFHQNTDDARELHLAVLAFDIPEAAA